MPTDILNVSEKEVVAFLKGDEDLAGEVNYIHEKIMQDISGYTKSKLPAIGVTCNTYDPEKPTVEGMCEIIVWGSGEDADALCKKITAQVVDLLAPEDSAVEPELSVKGIAESNARGLVHQVSDQNKFLWQGIVEFELIFL